MTFLRSSGLMDPEPSASKRLKADKTASYPAGKMAGLGWGRWLGWVVKMVGLGCEDGWVGLGRWLGWLVFEWLGRWLVWHVFP